MRRLSGQDSSFLYLETPSMHMHVAGIAVFDPSTSKAGYNYQRVLELTEERLHLVPLFRQRLAAVPFELHHPLWVDDPDFDLEYHIRPAALPAPGGDRELARFAADITSRPLDRSRPLWENYIVEGLQGGLVASVTKTHHAAIDGVSGVDLSLVMLDLQPDSPPVPPPAEPWRPERVPSDIELLTGAMISLGRQPFALPRLLTRSMTSAVNLGRVQRKPSLTPPPAPFEAPRTSLNVSIGPHRKFSFTSVPLHDVKAVKNALGGTVNDVVLALCSGTLRRYFADRGEQVDGPLVAMVPISVRTEEQKGQLGNQVSSMMASLASTIDDPVERLHAITAGTRGAKEQQRAIGADTLQGWAEFATPALAARAARLYSRMRLADRHRPIANLTISNVPGPPFPLYSLGAQMVASYPMGPIAEGSALNITVSSYMDTMFFGFHADRDSVGDGWILAEGVEEALEELTKAAASS